MQNRAILAVGDIMLDRFVYGDVSRVSPEAPIPVLTIKDENLMLGGVGNVLSNLTGLGTKVHVLAAIGQDVSGQSVRRLVTERGADAKGLVEVVDRPTTVKTRYLASHQQLLRADFEKTDLISSSAEDALLQKAEALIDKVHAVILSDYGKGVLTPKVIAGVIRLANENKIPVLVDPKGKDYSIYKGASVVTPNRKELSEATGLAAKTDAEVVNAAQTLIYKAGIEAVVATRSQDGMTVVRKQAKGKGYDEPVHLRTEALEVFDVSGAGDTVIATLAAALATGAYLITAASIANVAAGLVVAKVGTAPVRRTELLAALDRKNLDLRPRETGGAVIDTVREAPLCSADEAAETVARWKARGLRVGFTNGCFDILHQGHVQYLNRARDHCDRLIVALNADESVKRLKGAERPVNNEEARAAVLGALGAVDMVVLFGREKAEDDKPLKLIERLKPDIYFKGGDYKIEQLPEAPLVRAYGGEVSIMPLAEGHSTTATIKKMKGKAA
ncbi:MAG TPA: D-glycero-beta-D-manno-heptose-7-phosphate kinase [Patescibacteria group bacterium]|nr:D-glycero-beta-D-manno-heptose-7-phosphate kinase [Patescibacteria group bacterium]